MYSWLRVGRSLTLSGIGFGLLHTMSERRYQPSAWSAKTTRHGIPIRFLAGSSQGGDPSRLRGDSSVTMPSALPEPRRIARPYPISAVFFPFGPLPPFDGLLA